MHPACSMKIKLLFRGQRNSGHYLRAHELQGVQLFNRFVVCVCLQSWLTRRIGEDVQLIQCLQILSNYSKVAATFLSDN